jgi:hypothetical protein
VAALHARATVTPQWICEVCVNLVPVTGAAIVEMIDANRRELVWATDEVSKALATLQFTLGEGPCVQALSTRRPVLVSDLHEVDHPQWPMFAEAASQTPARARYSFPLQIGVISVGVLDLYRDQPGTLTDAELAGALLCANVAFWALLALRAGTDPDDMAPPWQWDLDPPRAQIHHATGMVMTQLAISAESALATLRAYAYSHDQPLDEVARQVITRRLCFPVDNQ